jgi:serine/threonine protein kinase
LIRYLSTWEKSNAYYILLPWANGSTLGSFWANNGPEISPRNQELIRKSLYQLLQLTDALRFLHSLNFRHGDLKPDNILHFTNRSGQIDNFVIADLGISKHHPLATGLRTKATMTKSTTATYEAPEVFTDAASGRPRPRKYDVWSMGCIILEYIIWLLWDIEAVEAFTASREYPAFAFYLARRNSVGAKIAVVHPEVVEVMKVLRDDPRCATGTALRDLIDLVESNLLVTDMDQRCEAAQLHAAMSEIVRKASTGDAYVLPPGARLPPMRPGIFQLKEVPGSAGSFGTRQS